MALAACVVLFIIVGSFIGGFAYWSMKGWPK